MTIMITMNKIYNKNIMTPIVFVICHLFKAIVLVNCTIENSERKSVSIDRAGQYKGTRVQQRDR